MTTLQLLHHLISIPSVSGQEKEIQEWIFKYLSSLGLKPKWVGPNVVCNIAGINTSKAIIFNGHVDTVSPGDIKQWEIHPHKPKEIDNKIYGLGASDMKSGVAVMLSVAQHFSKNQPPVDIWFHFVVGEETDGNGTAATMEWFVNNCIQKYTIVSGIIGEATENEEIRIAHKGNIFLKIITNGDTGHGSAPHQIKTHAISKMHKVAKILQALVASWEKKYTDTMLGVPTIAWTSIKGGDAATPNKIADSCVATFDLRTTPLLHDKALGFIQKAFAHKKVTIQTMYNPLSCGYTSPTEHIVQLAKKITKAKISVSKGSTDLLFFTKEKIPAIIFGPGTLGQGHATNECTNIKDLDTCVEVYKKIIQEF